jgi:hypothetical protein
LVNANSLQAINAQLTRCKLVQHGNKLYVRSSYFPPKPGGRAKGRQEIPTPYYARELKLAKGYALEIDGQLLRERFDWSDWLRGKAAPAVSVRDWLTKLEKDYFQRRERTHKTETTWKFSYWEYFQHLPLEPDLTEALLKGVLTKRYRATSRSRQLCSVAYGMLAEFAGLNRDEIRELGKGYKQRKKSAAEILTADRAILQLENCSSRAWQCAAALVAIFGLRNHEVFKVDLSRLSEGMVRVDEDTKTGARVAFACPFEWIAKFRLLDDFVLPNVTTEGRSNRAIGHSVQRGFKLNGLSHPYAFRDLHAVALEFAWDGRAGEKFKADSMGHSVKVHHENYLDAFQEMDYERTYALLQSNN